jgi:hypothetical protein
VQRDLIGLLHTTTGRKPLRNAGDAYARRGKQLREIMRRSLSLDIGSQCQDHFGGALLPDSLDEFTDTELLGADALQRGELTTQGMIAPAEDTGTLEGKDVSRRLHDAELASDTRLVTTENTLIALRKESAEAAGLELLSSHGDGGEKLIRLGVSRSHHPKGNPLRTTRTDAGKPAELPDKLTKGIWVIKGHGRNGGMRPET